jgi:hypothetical protein
MLRDAGKERSGRNLPGIRDDRIALQIHRYIDQHRAGASSGSQVEGMIENRRQLLDRLHHGCLLCHRLGHADDVCFLKA